MWFLHMVPSDHSKLRILRLLTWRFRVPSESSKDPERAARLLSVLS